MQYKLEVINAYVALELMPEGNGELTTLTAFMQGKSSTSAEISLQPGGSLRVVVRAQNGEGHNHASRS